MTTVEVLYMDGVSELFQLPAGARVGLEPTVLVLGRINVERDKVRRWQIIESEDT
jgi:hypothetical protein